MTIYEDTNSKSLLDLLDRIHCGDMVLPDFQRDFVWEPSATQALIVSIANNYPAGSILRVRDRQRAFSSRAFRIGAMCRRETIIALKSSKKSPL